MMHFNLSRSLPWPEEVLMLQILRLRCRFSIFGLLAPSPQSALYGPWFQVNFYLIELNLFFIIAAPISRRFIAQNLLLETWRP